MTATAWNPNPEMVSQVNASGLLKQETLVGTNGKRTFNLTTFAYAVGTGSIIVFKNGKLLDRNVGFFEVDTTTVLLADPTADGDIISILGVVGITGTAIVDAILRGDLIASTGGNIVNFQQLGADVVRSLGSKAKDVKSLKDFRNVVGDGVTDDTVAVQAAIDSGYDLYWGDSSCTYRITSKLIFRSNKQSHYGYATLKFDGTSATRLADITANYNTFEGVTFDGNSKQPNGPLVYVADGVKRPKFRTCGFQNITGTQAGTNILNQTYALVISCYGVTDFEIVNCLFKDLVKYNDGSYFPVTSGQGFIGGVAFMRDTLLSPSDPPTTTTRGNIEGCVFNNIKTILAAGLSNNDVAIYDDGDAIRTIADPAGVLRCEVKVTNCDFIGVSKRAFKARASGFVAEGNRIYAALGAYNMVVPIDTVNNNIFRNTTIYASAANPLMNIAQIIPAGEFPNNEILIDGLYVSHSKGSIQYFALSGADTLENITIRNVVLANVYDRGIEQATPTPATQRNIRLENIKINGASNTARAFNCINATDITSGVILRNVLLINADAYFSGNDADIDGVNLKITSNTYTGFSAGAQLFACGSARYGGNSSVRNVRIDASGASNSFSNPTRGPLVYLIGDALKVRNFNLKVADAQDVTTRHIDLFGTGLDVNGLTYEGPGLVTFGDTDYAPYSVIRNAVRKGTGACTKAFLYTNNASTTNVLLENVVDFRPTTANTITINAGSNFIVYNVSSSSSNATIVQHGGLAKTANINTF